MQRLGRFPDRNSSNAASEAKRIILMVLLQTDFVNIFITHWMWVQTMLANSGPSAFPVADLQDMLLEQVALDERERLVRLALCSVLFAGCSAHGAR